MQDDMNTEIDLRQIFSILWNRARLIVLVTILFGGVAFAITYFFITPKYTASVTLYVNNSSQSETLSSSDLSVSRSLVDTCVTIIQSPTVMEKVAEESDLDINAASILPMLSAGAISNTEIFEVSINSEDPVAAAEIANAIAAVVPDAIQEIVIASSVKVINYATVPTEKSSPSFSRNTAIGAAVGCVLVVMIVILLELLDVRIKTEEDLEKMFDLPVLGAIPVFDPSGK